MRPSRAGFGQWPKTKWWWSGALARARRRRTAPKIHRGKTLYLTERPRRSPIRSAEPRSNEWRRTIQAGLSCSAIWRRRALQRGGPAHRARAEAAGAEGDPLAARTMRCSRLAQACREPARTVGSGLSPSVGSRRDRRPRRRRGSRRRLAPERELPRWFSWSWLVEPGLIERLVENGRLARPERGWICLGGLGLGERPERERREHLRGHPDGRRRVAGRIAVAAVAVDGSRARYPQAPAEAFAGGENAWIAQAVDCASEPRPPRARTHCPRSGASAGKRAHAGSRAPTPSARSASIAAAVRSSRPRRRPTTTSRRNAVCRRAGTSGAARRRVVQARLRRRATHQIVLFTAVPICALARPARTGDPSGRAPPPRRRSEVGVLPRLVRLEVRERLRRSARRTQPVPAPPRRSDPQPAARRPRRSPRPPSAATGGTARGWPRGRAPAKRDHAQTTSGRSRRLYRSSSRRSSGPARERKHDVAGRVGESNQSPRESSPQGRPGVRVEAEPLPESITKLNAKPEHQQSTANGTRPRLNSGAQGARDATAPQKSICQGSTGPGRERGSRRAPRPRHREPGAGAERDPRRDADDGHRLHARDGGEQDASGCSGGPERGDERRARLPIPGSARSRLRPRQ